MPSLIQVTTTIHLQNGDVPLDVTLGPMGFAHIRMGGGSVPQLVISAKPDDLLRVLDRMREGIAQARAHHLAFGRPATTVRMNAAELLRDHGL